MLVSLPPTDSDPLDLVKRFQRTPATFSCLGMGCGTTLLVIAAAVVEIFLIRRTIGQ